MRRAFREPRGGERTTMEQVSWSIVGIVTLAFAMSGALVAPAAAEANDTKAIEKHIAELDTRYQAAVERNDAEEMAKILADDFVLVLGDGRTFTREDLLEKARTKAVLYERQVDSQQTVRVWGDTAIITALLWESGTKAGVPFDIKLWFSDVYVKTPNGWKYVFGQASLPLPQKP